MRHLDGAPWFEDYLRDLAARAAPDRLGDLRGRHRRRHGPLDRRRHARPATGVCTSRSRRRPSATARTRTISSPRCAARRTPSPATRSLVLTRSDQIDARADRAPGIRSACAARARPGYVVRAEFPPRAGPADPVLARRDRVDGPGLAHPLVPPVARASRPTPSTGRAPSCARQAQAEARRAPPPAAHAALARDERAVAAAGRGRTPRLGEFMRASAEPGRERLSTMAIGAALQQPQDRGLRAGAARLPGRDGRVRHRRLQERHAVQRRPPPARHDVGLPDGRQRAHPRRPTPSLLLIAKEV